MHICQCSNCAVYALVFVMPKAPGIKGKMRVSHSSCEASYTAVLTCPTSRCVCTGVPRAHATEVAYKTVPNLIVYTN